MFDLISLNWYSDMLSLAAFLNNKIYTSILQHLVIRFYQLFDMAYHLRQSLILLVN